jgi:phospholipase/carboxylesterase
VRAAFPVGGALPAPLWPPAATPGRVTPRLVALHGEDDELVPLAPTRRAVDALAQRGFDAKLETFPGVAHSVPPQVRARLFALLREELARR